MPGLEQIDWVEYSLTGGLLAFSLLIGLYYGFFKKGQDTVDGYLLGEKKMSVIPISASLICSFTSGVTVLGVPTEVYTFGTQFLMNGIGFMFCVLFIAFIMLPMFHQMRMISLYQLLFTPIVIYGPALALNQVSGIPVHFVTIGVTVICVVYTTIGGLKAVVWTDTLQGLMMLIAALLVIVVGTTRVGGLNAVLEAAENGKRVEFLNLDIDPRNRSTLWSVTFGLGVLYTSIIATNQCYMQRFISLPTLRKAQWSALNWGLGCYLFTLFLGYHGLIAYTQYKDCDPLSSGLIKRADQIMPYFIMDAVSDIRGLPGAYIAGIICAALSTMSTTTNAVAATIYADFIKPMIGQTSDQRASKYIKVISLMFGVGCVVMVLLIEKLGTILALTYSFAGISTGAILGVFVLGMFFPQANSKGATVGGLASLIIMAWILTGQHFAIKSGQIHYEAKPKSVDGCLFNATATKSDNEASFDRAFPLFEISYQYFSPLGAGLVIIVGLIVSYVTGSNRTKPVRRELLSHTVHRYLYTYVPTTEVQAD